MGVPVRIRGLIFSEREYKLSYDMIKAWTNFARTGHPGLMGGTTEWPQALDGQETVNSMNLDSADYKMMPGFYKEKCDAFWKAKIFA